MNENQGRVAPEIINSKFDIPVIYHTTHLERSVFERSKQQTRLDTFQSLS